MYHIVSSKIYVEWNDNPKMELVTADMPNDLAELYDEWLNDLAREKNSISKDFKADD
jgi:hypothetical protein|tara:strand:- start:310 stop:480 length:171 start_codon:yes stop_codon:yes gene_type:complete